MGELAITEVVTEACVCHHLDQVLVITGVRMVDLIGGETSGGGWVMVVSVVCSVVVVLVLLMMLRSEAQASSSASFH